MSKVKIYNSLQRTIKVLETNSKKEIIEFIKRNYPHNGDHSTPAIQMGKHDRTHFEGMWVEVNGHQLSSKQNGVSWAKLDMAIASSAPTSVHYYQSWESWKEDKIKKPHYIQQWEKNKAFYIGCVTNIK